MMPRSNFWMPRMCLRVSTSLRSLARRRGTTFWRFRRTTPISSWGGVGTEPQGMGKPEPSLQSLIGTNAGRASQPRRTASFSVSHSGHISRWHHQTAAEVGFWFTTWLKLLHNYSGKCLIFFSTESKIMDATTEGTKDNYFGVNFRKKKKTEIKLHIFQETNEILSCQ